MKFVVYVAVSFITSFYVLLVPFFIPIYFVLCFVCMCLILKIISYKVPPKHPYVSTRLDGIISHKKTFFQNKI